MLSSFLFSSYSMPAAIAVVKISVMSCSHLCYGLPLLHFPTTRIIFSSLFQSIVPLHVAKLSVFDACQHRTTIRIRLCGRYIHDYFISILISIYIATENTCSHGHTHNTTQDKCAWIPPLLLVYPLPPPLLLSTSSKRRNVI